MPPAWQSATPSPHAKSATAQESPKGSSMELTGVSMDIVRSAQKGVSPASERDNEVDIGLSPSSQAAGAQLISNLLHAYFPKSA